MSNSNHPVSTPATPEKAIADALESLDITLAQSPAALAETEYWLDNDGLDDPALIDLTSLAFITMDNEDSRDLDQALLIEPACEDGYRVRYALADASYYIRPGSALFDDALQRGTTYYTPLLAVPMLPVPLSEGLISLNPDVTRRALVFDIYLDNNAMVQTCNIVSAKIKSQAKLSYAEVQEMLDKTDAISPDHDVEPFRQSLQLLQTLGRKLIANSEARGVIRFNRVETTISTRQEHPNDPPRFHASLRTRYETERYNEQISLLCNMQGAELLLALSGVSDVVQAVYRVHEAPLRKNLGKLRQVLDSFADTLADTDLPDTNPADTGAGHTGSPGVGSPDASSRLGRWRWQPGQSLAEFVAALPDDAQHQRKVKVIQRQIMQAQRSSEFMPEPGEHHALKASSYARFSSPMREVVGIFTHKELLEALSGRLFDNDADEALRIKVIDTANSSRQRQRQLDKIIALAALQSHFVHDLQRVVLHDEAPDWHTGTIMGLRSDKLYISLDDLAMDVKIYKDDLNRQYSCSYAISETRAQPEVALAVELQSDRANPDKANPDKANSGNTDSVEANPNEAVAPSWTLGQGVKLQIQSFDASRRRLVFAMKATEVTS